MSPIFNRRLALLALVVLWLATRMFPLMHSVSWTDWEIWEAHKLSDYGFASRHGALIDVQEMSGKLPHPEDFNFVDHPYPMVWLDWLVYRTFGVAGVVAMVLAMRLAAMVFLFRLLEKYFALPATWLATALFAVAPDALVWDGNTNVIAFAAVIWPFATTLALKPETPSRRDCWLLGLLVFAGGQISWFSLTMVPVLLFMAAPWRGRLLDVFENPKCRAILAGALLTALLFFTQIVLYAPDFGRLVHYVIAQAGGAVPEVSRTKMTVLVAMRAAVWVWPALWVGAFIGMWKLSRSAPAFHPLAALVLYFPVFALTGLVLTRFFFVEQSPYIYLLFPATFLTAHALNQIPRLFFRVLLVVIAIPGIAYTYLGLSIPKITETSKRIGDVIARHTQPQDIVLSNFKSQNPPFQSWDTGSLGGTRFVADRLTYFDVSKPGDIEPVETHLGRNYTSAVFVVTDAQPISAELLAELKKWSRVLAHENVAVPHEPKTIAHQLREFIWSVSGRFKGRSSSDSAAPEKVSLEFYRLK